MKQLFVVIALCAFAPLLSAQSVPDSLKIDLNGLVEIVGYYEVSDSARIEWLHEPEYCGRQLRAGIYKTKNWLDWHLVEAVETNRVIVLNDMNNQRSGGMYMAAIQSGTSMKCKFWQINGSLLLEWEETIIIQTSTAQR
ncbi:MAG: hypothetical protein AAGI23_08270 [Bacteroidota bacterium]